MAPNPPVLASAVIVPEEEAPAAQGHRPAKRRQSSILTEDSKRPRIASPQEAPQKATEAEPQSSAAPRERVNRDTEERKRGKRLFGALLGTLNQSSPSAAQRRRGDIERKQQEKLKVQAQVNDEQLKKDREALLNARRLERDVYVKEAAKTRGEHELDCAHFLHTSAEPKLYYKPWDLLPEQKARIDTQVADAQAASEKQREQKTNTASESKDTIKNLGEEGDPEHSKAADVRHEDKANGSGDRNDDMLIDKPDIDSESKHRTEANSSKRRESETSREAPDDGGDDFVKGEEDDVIY